LIFFVLSYINCPEDCFFGFIVNTYRKVWLAMQKNCSKCGYITRNEIIAESECPNCGIVYAKYEAWLKKEKKNLQNSECLKDGKQVSPPKTTLSEVLFFIVPVIVFFGLPALFLIKYDFEVNQSMYFACKYLFAPIFFIGLIAGYLANKSLKKNEVSKSQKIVVGIIAVFGISALLLLGSGQYVQIINVLFSDNSKIFIDGSIVEKCKGGGTHGNTSYFIKVYTDQLNRNIKIKISSTNYKRTQKGAKYRSQWYKGSLGILYKKKDG
jgi:hypothetical protein